MEAGTVPMAALWIWGISLLVIALVIVPLAILLLHRTLRNARSIERYLQGMRAAGTGVAGHTAAVPALDQTIETATAMAGVAASLQRRSGAIATLLAERVEP
ncbi:MAG TPA: hypothetical protein VFZ01_12090 [Geminicoccaceae bacterium]